MDKELQSVLIFETYQIQKMRFNVNENYQQQDPIDIDFKIDVNVSLNEKEQQAQLTLSIKIFDNAEEKNYPFTLELSLNGYFSTKTTISDEEFIKFCTINGTTALFPFLRSIIADITKTANFPTLILPLINIYRLLEKQSDEKN